MQPHGWEYVLGMFATILLGIVVLAVLRLTSGPDDAARGDPIHLILSIVGRVLIATGFLAATVVVLVPIGLMFWVIFIVVFLAGRSEYRSSQRYTLLGALAAAAERFIPLVPTVEAFAQERGGLFGWRAKRLAAMLNSGVPLPEALHRSSALFPRHALPLIQVGCQSGALAAALRQASSIEKLEQPAWNFVLGRFFYLCFLASYALGISMFVMLRIVPSFQRIFKDFDMQMPAAAQAIMVGGRLVATDAFFFVPLLMTFVLLCCYAVLRYIGWIEWDLPGMGWLTRRLDTALIFDALALAAEHQRPLPEALECLARTYPKLPIRWRLRRALSAIYAGADWCESLRAQGLMKQADLAILQAAQRVGNLPWALREMADSNRRRLAYRLYALVQVIYPPVIVIFGLAVMLFVVGMFMPLITLIQGLAGN